MNHVKRSTCVLSCLIFLLGPGLVDRSVVDSLVQRPRFGLPHTNIPSSSHKADDLPPPVLEKSHANSTVPMPAPIGIRGYRRFHANDSFVDRLIPCTYEEKLCFRYNMLYYKQKDKCVYGVEYEGDPEELLHGSGHLVALHLKYIDSCRGHRMAFDGRCYQHEAVRDVICGCEAEPTRHFLGGVECRCSSASVLVQQPEEDGHCRVPDLRLVGNESSVFFRTPFDDIQGFNFDLEIDPPQLLECSLEQSRCFSNHTLWMAEAQGCFRLLERGPCAEEHVVAVDAEAARRGRAEGTCVHVRGGCPPGHVRMAFDGRCHSHRDLRIIITGKIFRNQFGQRVLLNIHALALRFDLLTDDESKPTTKCFVDVEIEEELLGTAPASLPYCGTDDNDKCIRYEVLPEIFKPDAGF